MISVDNARSYIHANGNLWERALWDFLFDGGSSARVQRILSGYKNTDGGFGHGLEHDIKAPMSNPLMLEFLLCVLRDTGLSPGSLLDGTPAWLEKIQNEDGTLQNPAELDLYPRAQWWPDGQDKPDSITGNMLKLNICPPAVRQRTRDWVLANLTLDSILANEWLYMAYHAFDYFMNEDDFPNIEAYRSATLENIYQTALAHEKRGEFHKLFPFFQFADGPESKVAKNAPAGLVDRLLHILESAQREDGGWEDEHGLDYWQPYFSTVILLALKRFGRI